jgi:hypothetical protein
MLKRFKSFEEGETRMAVQEKHPRIYYIIKTSKTKHRKYSLNNQHEADLESMAGNVAVI